MKRPSTPLLISLVALFFSLGGAGFAAQHATTSAASHVRVTIVYGKTSLMCPSDPSHAPRQCNNGISDAVCPRGTVVTGGGWVGAGAIAVDAAVEENGPFFASPTTTWTVQMQNWAGLSGGFKAVAYCVA